MFERIFTNNHHKRCIQFPEFVSFVKRHPISIGCQSAKLFALPCENDNKRMVTSDNIRAASFLGKLDNNQIKDEGGQECISTQN